MKEVVFEGGMPPDRRTRQIYGRSDCPVDALGGSDRDVNLLLALHARSALDAAMLEIEAANGKVIGVSIVALLTVEVP